MVFSGSPPDRWPLPPDPAHIDDPASARPDRDLEPAPAPPGAIHEVSAAAVHAANVPESAIAKNAFALCTADAPAVVQACADVDVDGDGFRRSRQACNRQQSREYKPGKGENASSHQALPSCLPKAMPLWGESPKHPEDRCERLAHLRGLLQVSQLSN